MHDVANLSDVELEADYCFTPTLAGGETRRKLYTSIETEFKASTQNVPDVDKHEMEEAG